MNNFINVRVQAHNHAKLFNVFKHNIRHSKTSLSKQSDNSNYIVFGEKEAYKLLASNKKHAYSRLSKMYQSDRAVHNQFYKKRVGGNLRERQGSYFEGVLTFSEQLKQDLGIKYDLQELTNIAFNCTKEIALKYGGEFKALFLHQDEATPHFHFLISNFDELGYSLHKKNFNKEFLSELQDLAHKHFSKLGMQRGIKKEFTNLNYKKVSKYWEEKIHENVIKESRLKNTIQSLIVEVNQEKNLLKEVKQEYAKSSSEYKALNIEQKNLQAIEQKLRDSIRNFESGEEYSKKIKIEIAALFKQIDKVEPFMGMGEEYYKLTKEKRDHLYTNIVNKLTHNELQEISKLKEENAKLKQDLNDSRALNANFEAKMPELLKSIDEAIKTIKKQRKENEKLRTRTQYISKIVKEQNFRITREMIKKALKKVRYVRKGQEQETSIFLNGLR